MIREKAVWRNKKGVEMKFDKEYNPASRKLERRDFADCLKKGEEEEEEEREEVEEDYFPRNEAEEIIQLRSDRPAVALELDNFLEDAERFIEEQLSCLLLPPPKQREIVKKIRLIVLQQLTDEILRLYRTIDESYC